MKKLTNSILYFWFKNQNKWFVKEKAFDNKIIEKFLPFYQELSQKDASYLSEDKNIKEILALIILFDQFPRNMFRNNKKSFETDEKALNLAKKALKLNYISLSQSEQQVLCLPFMHSEDLEDQELCVKLLRKSGNKAGEDYAIKHKKIINKFNRFPHRNEVLGRKSTEKETEFLKQPGSSF